MRLRHRGPRQRGPVVPRQEPEPRRLVRCLQLLPYGVRHPLPARVGGRPGTVCPGAPRVHPLLPLDPGKGRSRSRRRGEGGRVADQNISTRDLWKEGNTPMSITARLANIAKSLNTHDVGALGATLLAIAAGMNLPPVQSFVSAFPQTTQHTISLVQMGFAGLGALLAYLGRPVTVVSTTPLPPAK